jgi:hypothetical protein
MKKTAGLVLASIALGVSAVSAQSMLAELLQRHGVMVKNGGFDAAFDAHAAPTVPVTPGSFATPLAVLTSADGNERIAAAYAFGILAGRSGRAASAQELAAAGQSLVSMVGSGDRRTRIAGARVSGRLFAAPFDRSGPRPAVPPGLVDGLFALLNQDHEIELLAAMDAIGQLREISAASSLTSAITSIATATNDRWPAALLKRWRASATRRPSRSSSSWRAIAGPTARTPPRWPWRSRASACSGMARSR